ncbi:HesA/MoeB/ThiF family protein [Candidatus Solirubrobacter pratensis]|uniref:HesA/MoeB/ThiF family protein n=1 Tax=Candidatus Solirubrobacter pratensis TaxID=1298857 RepID=UPI00041217B0|nr:ThiF family adenylyltransferase [Candidatus Solirubrobacter pratensis]
MAATGERPADRRLDVRLGDGTDGRYHRQELISWWHQDLLRQARVLVVGAGALGNELVKNLCLLGVGTVVVCDLDSVENSNLARCVFFRPGDDGRPKAQVVAQAAGQLNGDCQVIGVTGDIRLTVGVGLYRQFDLILGGLDNREARLHVNQACWKAGVPWIDGAIEGLMGVMRVFSPPGSACYECTLSERDFELLAARRACSLLTRDEMLAGKVPTVATSSSVVAAMQVAEAVKLLHAAEPSGYEFAGRGVIYNGQTHDHYTVVYPHREDCLSHDSYDLEHAAAVGRDVPFADILHRALHDLGRDAVVELEHELVVDFQCGCGRRDTVLRPAIALRESDAACPACGARRRLTPTHRVDADSPAALLEATPDRVGLPAGDVITLRAGLERTHLILDGTIEGLQLR